MGPLLVLVAPSEEVVANHAEALQHVRRVLRVLVQYVWPCRGHRDCVALARGVLLVLCQARCRRGLVLPLLVSESFLALLAGFSAFALHLPNISSYSVSCVCRQFSCAGQNPFKPLPL